MIKLSSIQRFLYTVSFYLAIPILLLRLLWRSRYNAEYRSRWLERFGFIPAFRDQRPVIWLHAVSVGETIAALPLIKKILEHYSHFQMVITSTTPTGASLVRKHFDQQVTQLYLPFDLPRGVSRFLNSIKPSLGIILETELWPNLLNQCYQKKIPLLLANARLSPKSLRSYQKINSLASDMLKCFSLVASQAKKDEEHFLRLGLSKQKLKMVGNIKFDIELSSDLIEKGHQLRAEWGSERSTVIAASTHAGEEEKILESFKALKAKFPNLLLILVPRHPERFDAVASLCLNHYQIARRSRRDRINAETDILLVDTLGELLLFYAASQVAFVGGSWVPIGGHNLIEPAILGVPVLTGPYLHNFNEISHILLEAQAAKIVTNPIELSDTVEMLLNDSSERESMGKRGKSTILLHRGSLEKHMECIQQLLKNKESNCSQL